MTNLRAEYYWSEEPTTDPTSKPKDDDDYNNVQLNFEIGMKAVACFAGIGIFVLAGYIHASYCGEQEADNGYQLMDS